MLAALLAPFERSRPLALGTGVVFAVVGVVAGTLVDSIDAAMFLAVGVGGSTYYILHYRSLLRTVGSDSFSRGFVRNFALILPV
jgi:hypothetical protein